MTETYMTTAEAGRETGHSRTTFWRICRDHPGFAIKLGKTYQVPLSHIQRVKRGDTPAQIAADVARARNE